VEGEIAKEFGSSGEMPHIPGSSRMTNAPSDGPRKLIGRKIVRTIMSRRKRRMLITGGILIALLLYVGIITLAAEMR
jgi:hypothetical protein